jgi:hypothetical protein
LASIPDTDGAVGPDRFVEFINGAYRVYDLTGTVLQTMSADEFWTAAGVTPTDPFDPRVLYDPASGRWFASSADGQTAPGNILLAVSKTSDPTQGWQAFSIPASADGASWADFPTLGVNQEGVYLSAKQFSGLTSGNQILIAVPKADLLLPTPSIAKATFFYSPRDTGGDNQPAVAYQASGSEPIAYMSGSVYYTTSVDGPITSPTLTTTDRSTALPNGVPFGQPPPAMQKGAEHRSLHPYPRPVLVQCRPPERESVWGTHHQRWWACCRAVA